MIKPSVGGNWSSTLLSKAHANRCNRPQLWFALCAMEIGRYRNSDRQRRYPAVSNYGSDPRRQQYEIAAAVTFRLPGDLLLFSPFAIEFDDGLPTNVQGMNVCMSAMFMLVQLGTKRKSSGKIVMHAIAEIGVLSAFCC